MEFGASLCSLKSDRAPWCGAGGRVRWFEWTRRRLRMGEGADVKQRRFL